MRRRNPTFDEWYEDYKRLRREGARSRRGRLDPERPKLEWRGWAIERWPERIEVRPVVWLRSASAKPPRPASSRMPLSRFKSTRPVIRGVEPQLVPVNAWFRTQREAIIVARRIARRFNLRVIIFEADNRTWREG